ncbi:hypothetical protein FRC06_004465 [Ceratobasidium sp. 370]|nr:hypothetical protein FRC06_004465 [Ceratobasidium sp. 370]
MSASDSDDFNDSGDSFPELRQAEARDKCLKVLNLMHSLGLTLPVFLDHVCYGNNLCRTQGSMKKARRDLKDSQLLPGILDRLHTAPRTASKGKRAPGAMEPLEEWALSTSAGIFHLEVLHFAEGMKCDVNEIVDEKALQELTFQSILEVAEKRAPALLEVLLTLCEGTCSRPGRRMEKDSTFENGKHLQRSTVEPVDP